MAGQQLEELSAEKKRALLEKLLREKIAAEAIDFESEAAIEINLNGRSVDVSAVENPRAVFLTGMTGFVGAFVLRELVRRTDAQLYCLVRAANPDAGLKRIRDNLQKYGIWEEEYAGRIRVVLGDLSKPGIGIAEDEFRALSQEIDVIYHIAATVNLAQKYKALKPTNVNGTREILRLATTGRVKPLHYLSSYAPFDSIHNAGRTIYESDVPMHSQGLSTGYNETKWVAERMVRNAKAQGLPVGIYRVGWVVGHTQSGVWNSSDFIPRLIQACTALGKCTYLGVVTMTPVDYLVDALLYLSRRPASMGDTFHLSNGDRYSTRQLFEWVKGYGYEVEEVGYDEWEKSMLGSAQEAALMPMKLFLENATQGVKLSDWFSREPIVDSTYTRGVLAQGNIVPPQLNQNLMKTYVDYFISSGYLQPPS
ncbi:MAG: thioester reductase domain-containing protein [Myxococcota bacterium]